MYVLASLHVRVVLSQKRDVPQGEELRLQRRSVRVEGLEHESG